MRYLLALLLLSCAFSLLGLKDWRQTTVDEALEFEMTASYSGIAPGDLNMGRVSSGSTLLSAYCIPSAVSTAVLRVRKCPIVSSLLGVCTSLTADEAYVASSEERVLTNTETSVGAGNWLQLDVSSLTGTVDEMTCTARLRKDRP